MASESGKTRRRYGAQFKAMVLTQCDKPGASVAQVAMSHGINDDVVHRWRQLARQRSEASRLPMAASADSASRPVQFVPLEINRAAVTVSVAWPEHSLGDLAVFVRELLK